MTEHTRALLAEIAGTFMFFVIGAGAIVTASISAAPGTGLIPVAFAHGLALAVAVSSFGAISGGHFNPAVTFALAIARKHPWPRVPTYWAAQLVGALRPVLRAVGPGFAGPDRAPFNGSDRAPLKGRSGRRERSRSRCRARRVVMT